MEYMAKRFIDSDIFADPWFSDLTPAEKCFWIFILTNCDHAGIWKRNFKMASFLIRTKITDEEKLIEKMNQDKMRMIRVNGDYFVPDYIKFQYGHLNPNVKLHQSVINILTQKNIWDEDKCCLTVGEELPNTYQRVTKELGKSSATLKDKDKDITSNIYIYNTRDFEKIWELYPRKDGKKEAIRHFKASVKTKDDLKNIQIALENYLRSDRVKKGFVKNGSTWFNNWQDWVEYTEPCDDTEVISIPELMSAFDKAVAHYGSTELALSQYSEEKQKIIREQLCLLDS